MNEERRQAYQEIIAQLLNCASNEEVQQVLNANRELVDAGLVQMMIQAAEELGARGDRNRADFLNNLVRKLAELLGISGNVAADNLSPTATSEEYQDFLRQLLLTVAESNGNPEIVYPFLRQNLDKLNHNFSSTIQQWWQNTLPNIEPSQRNDLAARVFKLGNLFLQFPFNKRACLEISIACYQLALQERRQDKVALDWATTQNNLALAYSDRIAGDRRKNLENAIACYELALQERRQDKVPLDWAATQNNLGNAYLYRIEGDKGENLEKAIACYELALQEWRQDEVPLDWAMTQNNLGIAYSERIAGDRRENLERAIACYELALQEWRQDEVPLDWAMTQNNLANAYLDRIAGDKGENLEKAIACYELALQERRQDEVPLDWAATQNNLGIAYLYRIAGDRRENLERAIAGYELALQARGQDKVPLDWATTQNNLGNAYSERIAGNRRENLERAIACYKKALQEWRQDNVPLYWATTQNNLGEAYRNRIAGDRRENLERAFACYELALQERRQDNVPLDWAATQNNLGNAYRERIAGDKGENLENAIACYKKALQERRQDNVPLDWAATQNNLAAAYLERIAGDRRENLENAIACYELALQERRQDNVPLYWAMTQNNLGNAYRERIAGDKGENLENAIACYKKALQEWRQDNVPLDWAATQNNLAAAYSERIAGNKRENLEKAIACYELALQEWRQDNVPLYWATTQNNLGNAYRERIAGDKRENLEKAIACYELALQERRQDNVPLYWAMTQNNLGNAYRERIAGDRRENLERAIACYELALQEMRQDNVPLDWAQIQYNLGEVYFYRIQGEKGENIEKAYNTFKSAIDTVESLREEIVSGEETKRKHAEQWNGTYIKMVEVCLELGKINEAIEYVERSKTRNLVELILDRDLKTIFPLEVANQLEELRDQIASGQYKIQHGTAENPKVLAQELQQLRQQRNELQDRYLPVGSGFKFDQFQPTLAQRIAIIEWYITSQKILAFVVKPNGQELTVWQSQPEDREALLNLVREYLQDYYKTRKNQWQNQLEKRLKHLSKILHLESILDQIPPNCDRLILIPHRFLHLLPLHALPVGESYLLDRFHEGVTYAPSCQLLQQVQQRKRRDFQSLFAIQNPTGDLQFTDQEVNSILSLFPSHKVEVLYKSDATKAALDEATPYLQEKNYLHFSCHGSFNPDSPFLLLADAIVSCIPANADPKQYLESSKGFIDLSKCLTLGNLFERGFDLNKCRLVVLSACETGLIDFNNSSDEYIGLPSGFLYAGSSSVVSTLWTVDDMSTAYLMIKFLQILKESEDVSVAVALNQAQHWLRNITWEDLKKWSTQLDSVTSNNREIKPEIKTQVRKIVDEIENSTREIVAKSNLDKNIDEKPFQSPYHWAGFTAIGR